MVKCHMLSLEKERLIASKKKQTNKQKKTFFPEKGLLLPLELVVCLQAIFLDNKAMKCLARVFPIFLAL